MPKKSKGGKAFIKFVIDVDGKVKDIRVLKSSGDELLDKEAMRVIEIMPPWTPGKQNGKPVPVYFNLPINFKV
ncbi:MAG: energy transducer TonB [Bacteroidetes bacterium]|nr:energy transducer TonB [Bacteroidota bacterium]